MTAEELWQEFCQKENLDRSTAYEAWAFGGAPDYLAALVMQGIKTATASGYDLYFLAGSEEPVPKSGDYSVILDSKDQAVCVIRTVKTKVVPFDLVDEEQAYKEGEGNRSLDYWRKVHDEFFTEDYANSGMKFDYNCKILCEEFQLLYSVFEVVPFEEEDAKEICNWQYEGEYSVYNYPSWEECVKKEISFTKEASRQKEYYKVLKNRRYLGYFRLKDEGNRIELGVGIRPEMCGNKNGDMLVNLALAKISELYPGKKIVLTVRPFNQRAIKVYEKAGFRITKEYYEDRNLVPGNMYVMETVSR